MKHIKFFSIIMAVSLMLSLCACGNTATESETTVADTTAEVDASNRYAKVGVRFVEVDGETGTERELFALNSFDVLIPKGGATALDVLKQSMAELGFTYTLTADGYSMHKGLNLENTQDKYWTCTIDDDGVMREASVMGNAFSAMYVGNGDIIIFKYTDRP